MSVYTGASSEAPEIPGRLAGAWPDFSKQGLQAVLAALNHLLSADDRARASLQPHAGRPIRLRISSSDRTQTWLTLLLAITEQGMLEPADADGVSEPAVTMTVQPSIDAAFSLLQKGPAGLQSHLRIEGDVLLAAALGELSRSLRWDVEEDLSKVAGDVIAHRLVGFATAAVGALHALGDRLGTGFARHWSIEAPLLVTRDELDRHSAELSSLESRFSELERRGGVRR
jgi:ubiquinone biosynthesis protein UbiJ